MNQHTHYYKFESEMTAGHNHRVTGYTEYTVGFNNFHFHFFYGISSYREHTHYYSGITGMPIKEKNGHVHKVESILELNSLHEHKLNGFTFEEIAYKPKRLSREAYI